MSFRDIEGLRRTLRSLEPLRNRANGEVEFLIQDGGSGSGIEGLEVQFGAWAKIVSVPDEGIYDAMNLALARSSGDFVWFLNGGDESLISSWTRLRDTLHSRAGKILLFDYRLKLRNLEIVRRSRGGDYIWHGLPTSHQAILYPGNAARARPYDLRYKLAGDYAFTASLFRSGIEWEKVPFQLARFQSGGISQRHSKMIAIEANSVQREVLGSGLFLRWRSTQRHRLSRWLRALAG